MTAAIYKFPTDRVQVRPVPLHLAEAVTEALPASTPPHAPLSRRLTMERICLRARNRAEDADARRIWENHADWHALQFTKTPYQMGSLPDSEPAPTDTVIFDAREPHGRLLPWIIGGAGLAVALAAIPASLMPWHLVAAFFYLSAVILRIFVFGGRS